MTQILMKKEKHNQRGILIPLFAVFCMAFLLVPYTTTAMKLTEKNSLSSTSVGGWEFQKSGTTEDLNGVFFTSPQNGVAVGGVWDQARILSTTNGGETWTQTRGKDNGPTPAELLDVSFFDKNIGMAVGYYGTIIYTTNRGEWWNSVHTYYMNTYFACDMVNANVGYAVGVTNIFLPLVTRTTDGWQTFENFAFAVQHNDEYWEADLTGVDFISPTVGFATARVAYGQGAIVWTTDAGENWKTVYWNDAANMLSIDFLSEKVGYAAGDHGLIVKTIDGGRHWQVLPSGVTLKLRSVSFATKQVGNVVGDNGIILRTTNGGITWTRQQSRTGYSLHDVHLIKENVGWIVGEHGVILYTNNGGIPN